MSPGCSSAAARSGEPPHVSRRGFLAASGGAAVGALAGCSGGPIGGPDEVTFATLTIPAVAEVLIAEEEGYFEERDIDLQIERIQSAPKATPQLASGEYDVATGSIGASVFNSIAQDIDIRVVADQTQYWPGQPSSNRIWGRTAALEGAESIYDLPGGLTVGLHGSGNVDSYIIARILELNGLSWADMETTEVMYTNMPVTMAEGEIDLAAVPDPLGLQVSQQADATQLGYASMVAPRMQIGAYLFGGPFADERPGVATRWLEAYLEGVRSYYEMGGFQNENVATIISDAFELPADVIRMSIPSLPHKNGLLNRESIDSQQTYHHCQGTVEETVSVDDVVEESFLESALETVGRLEDEQARPSVSTIEEWGQKAPVPYPSVGEERVPENFPESC
ncbi:MAG: ABC transporter substrate-binding protein [Halodesulfurarchaeum sp.]